MCTFTYHGPQTILSMQLERCVYTTKNRANEKKISCFWTHNLSFLSVSECRFPSKNGSTPKGTNQRIRVDEGVRGVNEMRRHLRHYVSKVLFKEEPVPPRSNRRFFPSKVDLRNCIYESVVKNRWSNVDQGNLEKKIEECKRESPEDFIMFHPYAQVQADFQQSCDNGDDDDDDSEEEVVEVDSGKEGLLFVHQTKWQRRLLNRYGNELSLLDATYRTKNMPYHCFPSCKN